MTRAFGPPVVVGEEFAGLPGLAAVAIYGSWAARYDGRPGPPPNDVDVLATGQPNRSQLYAVQQLKSEPLHWVAGSEPFRDGRTALRPPETLA